MSDQKTSAPAANQLDQLKSMTTVVADTGDIEAIRKYQPQDATTNPSLILKAVQMDQYSHLLDKAIEDNRGAALPKHELVTRTADELLVLFGSEILEIIPAAFPPRPMPASPSTPKASCARPRN